MCPYCYFAGKDTRPTPGDQLQGWFNLELGPPSSEAGRLSPELEPGGQNG